MKSTLWPSLEGRRVLLGVSGGIAAYKTAELCRLLVRCGATVQVMMTAAARRFVGEVTFSALSNHPVVPELFDEGQEGQIRHIDLADRTELLLIAPATANLLAKLAHGLANDVITTVYLAYTGKVLLAPAMNVHMWEHPATKNNLQILRQRGHQIVGPASGEMACGHVGEGRMAEPEQILQAAGACLAVQDLASRSIMVTAGPTQEPIDPIRFLSNRSSGKMGFSLAAVAATRGARVTLVTGPSSLPTPFGVDRVDVMTAAQMAEAVHRRAVEQDAIFMVAAVADYRPSVVAANKLKKEDVGDRLTLVLERNRDILADLGASSPHPVLVGFAAETEGYLDAVAHAKRAAKGCDVLVVNDVTAPGAGFETDTNQVVLYDARGGREALPVMSKRNVAEHILNRVVLMLIHRPINK